MSILRKIVTAIRSGAREVGELVVDANGSRIFEQEIRDAEDYLRKAKQDLTEVMAKQMQASRQAASLKNEITGHEEFTRQALAKGNESLAFEIAEKIAELESDFHEQQHIQDTFSSHVSRLKDLVKKTERQIKDYERQLSMVKTTESVQRASAAISDNFALSSSKIMSARDSLERIKQRQQVNFDRLEAAEQLQKEESSKSLEEKLLSAGILEQKSDADAVLERIRSTDAH